MYAKKRVLFGSVYINIKTYYKVGFLPFSVYCWISKDKRHPISIPL